MQLELGADPSCCCVCELHLKTKCFGDIPTAPGGEFVQKNMALSCLVNVASTGLAVS
jgi:hypothetical protein